MSTWEGTNDIDATATDPTGGTTGQAAGNNMVEVTSYVYDADGDVTSMTEYPDSNSADNRTTTYGYDWHELQTYVVNPPDAQGDVSYTMTTYDNLGEATETQTDLYQGTTGRRPRRRHGEPAREAEFGRRAAGPEQHVLRQPRPGVPEQRLPGRRRRGRHGRDDRTIGTTPRATRPR